jgi:hypothetical protein
MQVMKFIPKNISCKTMKKFCYSIKPVNFVTHKSSAMKKYCFIAVSLVLSVVIFIFSGCKNNTTEDPCNNLGKLCVENKMDSSVTVNIVQKKQQITLQKDYMECFDLEGNMPYTISVSGAGYTKPDTTLMILPCDNKLYVISQ